MRVTWFGSPLMVQPYQVFLFVTCNLDRAQSPKQIYTCTSRKFPRSFLLPFSRVPHSEFLKLHSFWIRATLPYSFSTTSSSFPAANMGSSNEDLLERVLYAYEVKNMYIQTLDWLIDWLFKPLSTSIKFRRVLVSSLLSLQSESEPRKSIYRFESPDGFGPVVKHGASYKLVPKPSYRRRHRSCCSFRTALCSVLLLFILTATVGLGVFCERTNISSTFSDCIPYFHAVLLLQTFWGRRLFWPVAMTSARRCRLMGLADCCKISRTVWRWILVVLCSALWWRYFCIFFDHSLGWLFGLIFDRPMNWLVNWFLDWLMMIDWLIDCLMVD